MFASSQSVCHTGEKNLNNPVKKESSTIKSAFRNKIEVLFGSTSAKAANIVSQSNTAYQDDKIYLLNTHTAFIIEKDFGKQAGEKVKIAIENIAATIIQRFCRKVLARNTYNYMFTKGRFYKSLCSNFSEKYKHFNKYKKHKNKQFDSLEDMQKFSTFCLREIEDKLGILDEKEQRFVAKINSFSNMILMHRSYNNLLGDKVIVYSNKVIKQKKINLNNSHTSSSDIATLANDDFIFSTPYFSSSQNSKDIINQIIDSGIINLTYYYGNNAYFFKNEDSYNGYLTLTDHYINRVIAYYILDDFKELYTHIERRITGFEKFVFNDVPMFTQKDMKLGLAYYTIYFLRSLKKYKKCRDFCSKTLSVERPEDFNKIMHTIFNPEFHVPKMLVIKKPELGINFVHDYVASQ